MSMTVHEAAAAGDIRGLRAILHDGADLHALDENSLTPLQVAALHGRTEAAELLLAYDANVNARCVRRPLRLKADGVFCGEVPSECYCTPLHLAVSRGRGDTAELLRTHGGKALPPSVLPTRRFHLPARAQKRRQYGAAIVGETARLQRLLDADPDVEVDARVGGVSLLEAAVKSGHASTVRLLLDRGATVNATDSNGRTSLHWAAGLGHTAIARLLLDFGATPDAWDYDARTPLELAEMEGHTETAALLRSRGGRE